MKPKFEVDFNELMDFNLILLSQKDIRKDVDGNDVVLSEGLEIDITEENYEGDVRDDLIASGYATKNSNEYDFYKYFPHVKWLCKINSDGIRCVSDL